MTEIDATPSADPEKIQTPINDQDEVVSEQKLHNQVKGPLHWRRKLGTENQPHKSGEIRGQRKAVGKNSMAHPTENTRYGSTREDTAVEEMDTGLMDSASERIQDDARLARKELIK
jgi:hypothetical protein